MPSKKLIKKCSKHYLYIILTALFFVLKNSVLNLQELGFNDKNYNVFGINVVADQHILMKLLLEYSGYTIFGILFKIIFDKDDTNNIQDNNINRNITISTTYIKIINDQSKNQKIKLLLIASIFFSIQLMVRKILIFGSIWMFDLWIFNIIFIFIFMKYILHTRLYKHQIYALILNFTINLIILITCSNIKHNEKSEYDNIKDTFGSYFYVLLFYFTFLILSALLSSSEVLQKKLMDIYYVTPYTILIMFGVISCSFCLIVYIVTSLKSCEGPSNPDLKYCSISLDNNKEGPFYFDNFKIYIHNMQKRLEENKTSFYLEIFLVYPLYSFFCFIKYFYETLVVWQLNPNFVLLSDNIYYSIRKIITLISDPTDIKTYLKLVGEMLAIVGYLFYLEIFEIKFCGLNKNTKENISLRGINDTNIDILLDEDNDVETFCDENNNINIEKEEDKQKTEMVNLGGYIVDFK